MARCMLHLLFMLTSKLTRVVSTSTPQVDFWEVMQWRCLAGAPRMVRTIGSSKTLGMRNGATVVFSRSHEASTSVASKILSVEGSFQDRLLRHLLHHLLHHQPHLLHTQVIVGLRLLETSLHARAHLIGPADSRASGATFPD